MEQQHEWQFKVLEIKRVSHMTVGGRKFKLRAIIVGGDGNGHVGVGVAQGKDSQQAIEKAKQRAQQQSIRIPLREKTIPHETTGKSSASVVLLRPAPRGHGLVAGGTVRALLMLGGVEEATAKNLGRTKNKLTTALATFKALSGLRARRTEETA